jgi:pimeloyl-ACP methyl ester carboxylesterase
MQSRDSYANQIEVLAKDFTVIAPDSREQGRSSASPTQISYELMAQDINSLASLLGHEKIYVIGQSDGGITAITLAINNPALIEKLILVGTNFNAQGYTEEARSFIASYEWDGDTDPEGYPGMFIEHYLTGRENLSEFGDVLREMAQMWTTSPNFEDEDLHAITVPTLIINGDREDIPLDHVLALHANLPNSQLFVMPGNGHFLNQENPDLFNRVVRDFLQSQ